MKHTHTPSTKRDKIGTFFDFLWNMETRLSNEPYAAYCVYCGETILVPVGYQMFVSYAMPALVVFSCFVGQTLGWIIDQRIHINSDFRLGDFVGLLMSILFALAIKRVGIALIFTFGQWRCAESATADVLNRANKWRVFSSSLSVVQWILIITVLYWRLFK